jgi:hypothetical protein
MIATFYRYGRLGNRLFTFSNLIAFSELHKVPVAMPAFAEYRKDFPYFNGNPLCVYGPNGGYLTRIVSALSCGIGAAVGLVPTVRFWDGRRVYFDAEDEKDSRVQKMIQSRTVLFQGWDFCSRRAIIQFRDRIRSVFSPRTEVIHGAKALRSQMLERADVLVGVHVRWGDYRGTDRFFELAEYLERMGEIRALLSPSKPAFLIFSPEAIPRDALLENNYVCSTDPMVDLYSLAECDYLFGPPSTFSMWASYYGGKPLFIMKSGRKFNELSYAKMATP